MQITYILFLIHYSLLYFFTYAIGTHSVENLDAEEKKVFMPQNQGSFIGS